MVKQKTRVSSEMRRIITPLLIMAALVLALNLGMSHRLRTEVVHLYEEQQERSLRQSAQAIDSFLSEIHGFCLGLQVSPSVMLLQDKPNLNLQEEEVTVREITRRFNLLRNRHPLVGELFLYLYGSQYLLLPEGYLKPATYLNNRHPGSEEAFLSQLASPRQFGFFTLDFPGEDGGTTSVLYLGQTLKDQARATGIVAISINQQLLIEQFQANSPDPATRFVIVQDGVPVIDQGDAQLMPQLVAASQEGRLLPGTGLVTHQDSEAIRHLDYYIITPEEVVLGGIPRQFLVANLSLILATALLTLGSFMLLRRLYRPIGQLSRLARSLVAQPEGRLRDSQLIQYALETIWRNKAALETSLSGSAPYAREALLYRLLLNDVVEEPLLMQAFPEEEGSHETACRVFVLHMAFSAEDSEHYFEQYERDLIARLRQAAQPYLVGLVKTGVEELTLVCRQAAGQDAGLTERLTAVVQEQRRLHPDSYYVMTIGSQVAALSAIGASYRDAVNLFKHRRMSDEGCLLHQGSGDISLRNYQLSPGDVRTLSESASQEEVLALLKEILARNMSLGVSAGVFVQLCSHINGILQRRMARVKESGPEALLAIDAFNTRYRGSQLEEILKSNAVLLFEALKNVVEEDQGSETAPKGPEESRQEASPEPTLADRLTAYVDEHFNQNINLSTVADHFGYTPAYLSRYFKQSRGINFTDYLNSRKVEYACRLLSSRDAVVKDVAAQAGFNSDSQFIATFVQYTGVTPGVYKRQHKQLGLAAQKKMD